MITFSIIKKIVLCAYGNNYLTFYDSYILNQLSSNKNNEVEMYNRL